MRYNLGKYKITPKGEYNANATYDELDLISYNNSTFLALKTVKGIEPTDDNINYQVIVNADVLSTKDYVDSAIKTAVGDVIGGES